MQTPIRVVLADDFPLIRQALCATLNEHPAFLVVGQATTGAEAIQSCTTHHPDVLLLDLDMPGPPAQDVIAHLQAHCPDTKVIMLSAYSQAVVIRSLFEAGARGYIIKTEPSAAVMTAIETVQSGAAWLSAPIMPMLCDIATETGPTSVLDALTTSEREILNRIGRGWSNAQIAQDIYLAEHTVRNYVTHIYRKLGVRTRVEAVIWAHEHIRT